MEDNMSTLITEAKRTGYINGFTAAMDVVNESIARTRNENMNDGERIITMLQDLLNASFKNHD